VSPVHGYHAVHRSGSGNSVRRRKGPGGTGKATGRNCIRCAKIEGIKLNHRGIRCKVEAIVEDYALSDPAIQKLSLIVCAADVKGQEKVAAEGIGLRSIAQGFAAMGLSDEERLTRQFPIYDALYAFVQSRT